MRNKVLSLALVAIMVFGINTTIYANEVDTSESFQEAGTVYVTVESRTVELGNNAQGALPARPEDMDQPLSRQH